MAVKTAIEKAKKTLQDSQVELSAPIPVRDIAGHLRIDLVEEPDLRVRGKEVSAFLLRREGRVICVVNRDHHENRKRFSIAHEVAHAVLHPPKEWYIDPGFSVAFRDDRSSQGVDRKEVEANAFAAEILMPEELLRRDVQEPLDLFDDVQVARLALRYRVSEQAMTIRLTNLRLFVPPNFTRQVT